ncbi:DUF6712 family protein [Bacteroides sp. UBA939]|uniref:DUF6712 family protein n=1 Tax=Bacteroides sp. UBA939 TaxID=1946092 RepID=UPI0025C566F1|nr:DUF6712 family protein [Bacteroides sp. UBA939]
MNAIIPDAETLKTVVKINAAIPYESLLPYINDALDIYIEPQVGNVIVEIAGTGGDTTLKDKVLRCLGPLTLALATDELGIQFGDSGITVQNDQGKRSPANEAKIAAAKTNLFYRGMQALDRLLDYLERNKPKYPNYADHIGITNQVPCFIRSAQEYQDIGLVNIDYSTLTYRTMLPTLRQIQERHVREMLTDDLYNRLLTLTEPDAKFRILQENVIRYLANKSAELYTSQTSRQERTGSGTPEYQPVLRPIYQDSAETGNFFAQQADYYSGKIHAFVNANADHLGISKPSAGMNFNSKEKKLFTSIS